MKFRIYANSTPAGIISSEQPALSWQGSGIQISASMNPIAKTLQIRASSTHNDCVTNVLEIEPLDGDYIATVSMTGYERASGWYHSGASIREPNVNYGYNYDEYRKDVEQLILKSGKREIIGMWVGGWIYEVITLRTIESS